MDLLQTDCCGREDQFCPAGDRVFHLPFSGADACYTEGARKQKDPLLPAGTEKVPDASDKPVKSTECKETRRETEVSILIKELFNSDIRTEREIIQIQKGLEKEESQDRPKEAI